MTLNASAGTFQPGSFQPQPAASGYGSQMPPAPMSMNSGQSFTPYQPQQSFNSYASQPPAPYGGNSYNQGYNQGGYNGNNYNQGGGYNQNQNQS